MKKYRNIWGLCNGKVNVCLFLGCVFSGLVRFNYYGGDPHYEVLTGLSILSCGLLLQSLKNDSK